MYYKITSSGGIDEGTVSAYPSHAVACAHVNDDADVAVASPGALL